MAPLVALAISLPMEVMAAILCVAVEDIILIGLSRNGSVGAFFASVVQLIARSALNHQNNTLANNYISYILLMREFIKIFSTAINLLKSKSITNQNSIN